jgi:hypothetical protein
MFPDLRNNLKSSGPSLYECSISYSTLKRSFVPRILTTTSGGGTGKSQSDEGQPTIILLSIHISLTITITTTMMMGGDLCDCLLIGSVHTINSYAVAEGRSHTRTEVMRRKQMILTPIAPCNSCCLRVKIK